MRGLRSLGLLALYVGAQLVALALAFPFRSAGLATTANPNSPLAPLYIIALVIVAPLVLLWIAARRGGLAAIRIALLVLIGSSLTITLQATFALFLPHPFFLPPAQGAQVLDLSQPLSMIAALTIFLALLIEPQWYVVDFAGFVAAGSLIALLGISFGILPSFILLIALAVYDAIAVYRTKHMISLAEVVTEMKLPILMVMPTGGGYDYTKAATFQEQREHPVEEREAMFMGLGDVVIPGTLIVSAFSFLPGTPLWLGVGANLIAAIGTLIGSVAGYLLLMRFVAGGNPQAGLPLLNGGALTGYVLTYLLLFRNVSLGIHWGF